MNRSVLLMPLALLGACNVHSKNPANSGDEAVTINADEGGNIAFNLPFVKGQVKVPAGMMHNGNFDIDGVKLMPGSQVTGVSVDAHNEGATVNVAFSAPASPDTVRAYFVDEFKKQGVEAAIGGDSVTGKSKDGSPFIIQVASAESGSKGTIVIRSKA
jgi:hypothetical protein